MLELILEFAHSLTLAHAPLVIACLLLKFKMINLNLLDYASAWAQACLHYLKHLKLDK